MVIIIGWTLSLPQFSKTIKFFNLLRPPHHRWLRRGEHDAIYQAAIDAYNRVFDRLGIGEDTLVTFADGGAFTQFSHEFQTICDAGEDIIYINREKGIAINEEVLNDSTLK